MTITDKQRLDFLEIFTMPSLDHSSSEQTSVHFGLNRENEEFPFFISITYELGEREYYAKSVREAIDKAMKGFSEDEND